MPSEKKEGDTYVSITDKGEDVSRKLSQELIAYGEIANMNKTESDGNFKAKKGVKQKRLSPAKCAFHSQLRYSFSLLHNCT